MKKDILKKLGLSETESDIYMFLLKNPNQGLSDLSNKLFINRPKLYKTIPAMIESGLISKTIIWKRIFYIAENPDILSNYFEKIKEDFDIFIPEIKSMYWNNLKKPIFKHLSWKIWIRNIFIDIWNSLNKWDTFYRYSSRKNYEKTSIKDSEYNKYRKLREEKKLERMVITNHYLNSLKEEKLEREIVLIPKDFDIFEDNITKIIYANKVAIIDYNTYECFIIESQIFSNFEKKIFKLLFKFLRKNNI